MRLSRSRLSALLASLALALPMAGVATVATSPAEAAGAQRLKVATYNVRAGVSTSTFRRVVDDLLPYAGVIGLQEVNSHEKEAVLGGLRSRGWGYFRASRGSGEQNPVLWRTSRFSKISARSVKTAGARAGVGAHYATVVRLRVRATGQKIAIVNVHLPPGAIKGGLPSRSNPGRFDRYADELVATRRVAQAERRVGSTRRRVFVTGDLNSAWVADRKHLHRRLPIRIFRGADMPSMWATERPSGGRGTHESSLIDQVYSQKKALDSRVLFGIRGSDHFPALATYAAR